jgi:hypothetical protein
MTAATSFVEKLHWLWRAILLACFVQIAFWAADRTPPFVLGPYTSTSAPPGGTVRIVAKVQRDLSRKCSVVFSRHLIDASGARYDLVSGQTMSAYALEAMEKLMPGELRLQVHIPPGTPPGLAHLFTVLEYSCNPFHRRVSPIELTIEMDFIVEKL